MADQDQATQTSNFLQSTEGEPAQVTAEDLVGEGKKFKDSNALAYGKEMADRHITTLEAENQRLRDQAEAFGNQEDLIKELKEEMSKPKEPSVQAEVTTPSSETTLPTQDLQEQIKNMIAADKVEATEKDNITKVTNAMVAKYGENWDREARRIASEKGMSLDVVNLMVARSPDAFLELAGIGETSIVNQPSGVTGTINTEAMAVSKSSGLKDNTYYETKRVEMGDAAFFADIPLQTELLNNAHEMGDTFFKA